MTKVENFLGTGIYVGHQFGHSTSGNRDASKGIHPKYQQTGRLTERQK